MSQLILLKPSSNDESVRRAVEQQFNRSFRVRRGVVLQWLTYLRTHHDDYRNIELSQENIDALPQDGSVHTRMQVHEVIECPNEGITESANDNDDNSDQEDAEGFAEPRVVAVPDLMADQTELERAQAAIQFRTTKLSVPSFRQTPISEWNRQCVFRMAFPSLFPDGKGDFYLPREHQFTLKEWIRHLLRYHDKRFARHPRFRYVVFNTLLRADAKVKASYLCRKVNGEDISLEDLNDLVERGDPTLINRITRSAEQIRGTRPYWGYEGRLLESKVLNLCCPHLFFTFSAADLQWHDLRVQMPDFERLFELSEQEQYRAAARNLTDNPHIAAAYLVKRFELFFSCVIKKLFDVQDYWYRFEWQDRGSGHIHGFLWLNGPPQPNTDTEESRNAMAQYWTQFVTASNPQRNLQQIGKNPASLPFGERSNTKLHLAECITRYQRHSQCIRAYCLRKVKGSADMRCRFHFPIAHRKIAGVTREQNFEHYKYMAVRNDSLLNAYNPTITLGWNANTDMSPCTNTGAVLHYAAKYASKAETKSASYKELFSNALLSCSVRNPFLSTAIKMLNRLIAERDWSSQEINHLCLNLPLVRSSRRTVSLFLYPPGEEAEVIDAEEGGFQRRGLSWLQKYIIREGLTADEPLQDVSLFEFVREFHVDANHAQRRPRAPFRLLQIIPRYSSNPTSPQYEDYCRVKLMLHHPFTNPMDLRMPDDDGVLSYAFAYQVCRRECGHPRDPLDTLAESRREQENQRNSDSEFDSEQEDEEPEPELQAEWTEWAARNGRSRGGADEDLPDFGTRDIDLQFDWQHQSDIYYELFGEQDDWYKEAQLQTVGSISGPSRDPNTLNPGQRVAFDLLMTHYSDLCSGDVSSQLLIHLDGEAGSGKSYLIDMISQHLREMGERYGHSDPVLRSAPTGIAAFSI